MIGYGKIAKTAQCKQVFTYRNPLSMCNLNRNFSVEDDYLTADLEKLN